MLLTVMYFDNKLPFSVGFKQKHLHSARSSATSETQTLKFPLVRQENRARSVSNYLFQFTRRLVSMDRPVWAHPTKRNLRGHSSDPRWIIHHQGIRFPTEMLTVKTQHWTSLSRNPVLLHLLGQCITYTPFYDQ